MADHNTPGEIGAGPMPKNALNNMRQSTALTYLTPAVRQRVNLTIRSETHIDRVLFEGSRAVGVAVTGTQEIISGHRIILAAGAYDSPAILLRSGLGPTEQLRTLGIPVLENLAGVGQNLIDHPVGTCRMGRNPAAGAVVDARGHVHGVDGLLVIDASIMPTIPAANTLVPVVMVAERCAAWLTEND